MNRVLFCDLDGTLLVGDSLLLFLGLGVRTGWISPVRLAKVLGSVALNRLSLMDRDRLRQLTYDILLSGREYPGEIMERFVADLLERRPWHRGVVSILESERARGTKLVMITNSFDFLAAPIAEHFSFDVVHAVEAPMIDARFVPSSMKALIAERKEEVAREYLGDAGYSIGIGNSRDDHAFIALCDRGVYVASSPGKIPARHREGWELLPSR